jgi:hypothetical protein
MDKNKNNSRERSGPRVRFGSASRPCPEDHHWNFSGPFFRRHSLILAAPGFALSISLLQANCSNGLRHRPRKRFGQNCSRLLLLCDFREVTEMSMSVDDHFANGLYRKSAELQSHRLRQS